MRGLHAWRKTLFGAQLSNSTGLFIAWVELPLASAAAGCRMVAAAALGVVVPLVALVVHSLVVVVHSLVVPWAVAWGRSSASAC